MTRIELIYDRDCPHVQVARDHVRKSLVQAHLPPGYTQWDRADTDAPDYVARFGSPTILVDGCDVAGGEPLDGAASCRLYRDDQGRPTGAPPVSTIVAALSHRTAPNRAWRSSLGAAPALVMALLPKLACPACWPAYAGLLSAMGLGFLIDSRHLMALTGGFLILAVGLLMWRAPRRRGYAPALVGAVAGLLIVGGKFMVESDTVMYAGIAVLIAASVWNAWPKKFGHESPCCPTTKECSA